MKGALSERAVRRALIALALAGLLSGFAAWAMGRNDIAQWCWAGGTIPVVVGLLVSMIRDFLAGRLGVDAVAFVSMSGALALGQNLAGIVIALMYAGGNVLEDFAVAHAERDLRSLIDRAPKIAHRRSHRRYLLGLRPRVGASAILVRALARSKTSVAIGGLPRGLQ